MFDDLDNDDFSPMDREDEHNVFEERQLDLDRDIENREIKQDDDFTGCEPEGPERPDVPIYNVFDEMDDDGNFCGLCGEELDEDGFHEDGVCPKFDEDDDM
jgi:hypothetical protein